MASGLVFERWVCGGAGRDGHKTSDSVNGEWCVILAFHRLHVVSKGTSGGLVTIDKAPPRSSLVPGVVTFLSARWTRRMGEADVLTQRGGRMGEYLVVIQASGLCNVCGSLA